MFRSGSTRVPVVLELNVSLNVAIYNIGIEANG